MSTSTSGLNFNGRLNRVRRRSNVRQNWSRVIQLFMITMTVFVSIILVAVALWFGVGLATTFLAPAEEPGASPEAALAQVEAMPMVEATRSSEMASVAGEAPLPMMTPTSIPIEAAAQSETLGLEPTFTPTAEPTFTSTSVPEPACTASPGQAYPAIRLRSGPYTSQDASHNLGGVPRGDSVRILSKYVNSDGLFYKVTTKDGQIGWVPAIICITATDMNLVQQEPVEAVPTQLPIVQAQVSVAANTQSNEDEVGSGQSSQNVYFRASVVESCDPGATKTWFDGYVFVNGVPTNSYKVWFGSRFGGTQLQQTSGPHEGYWDWSAGYYAHIVDDPRRSQVKHLRVWITDDSGNQISEDAQWDTNCGYARIDFHAP